MTSVWVEGDGHKGQLKRNGTEFDREKTEVLCYASVVEESNERWQSRSLLLLLITSYHTCALIPLSVAYLIISFGLFSSTNTR